MTYWGNDDPAVYYSRPSGGATVTDPGEVEFHGVQEYEHVPAINKFELSDEDFLTGTVALLSYGTQRLIFKRSATFAMTGRPAFLTNNELALGDLAPEGGTEYLWKVSGGRGALSKHAVCVASDGRVYTACADGAYRYDGVRFTSLVAPNQLELWNGYANIVNGTPPHVKVFDNPDLKQVWFVFSPSEPPYEDASPGILIYDYAGENWTKYAPSTTAWPLGALTGVYAPYATPDGRSERRVVLGFRSGKLARLDRDAIEDAPWSYRTVQLDGGSPALRKFFRSGAVMFRSREPTDDDTELTLTARVDARTDVPPQQFIRNMRNGPRLEFALGRRGFLMQWELSAERIGPRMFVDAMALDFETMGVI
jgi:hypothetical protein